MKRNYLISLIFLALTLTVSSQQTHTDVRTDETKIADLLMQLPAQSSMELDRIMEELSQFGGKMITGFAPQLVPPGKGDDSRLRYAISGMVKYASSGDHEKNRKVCSEALCEALALTEYEEVKDFLLQELQYVAGDEAVPVVSAFLTDKRLCDPAARVLVRINSEVSNEALLQSLSETDGDLQAIIIQALGETRYGPAAETFQSMVPKAAGDRKKLLLRAMAETGDPGSARLLASEAEKAGYACDATDATGSYLLFISRSALNNNLSYAEKTCRKLIKSKAVPLQTKGAVLGILTGINLDMALPYLYGALDSENAAYRMTALDLLGDNYSQGISNTLQKKLGEASDPVLKSEIVCLFGEQNDESALPGIIQYINDEERQLQFTSIEAAAGTGSKDAVQPLMEVMKHGDKEIVAAVKRALLTIEGVEVADRAADLIPEASGAERVALIEIVAERRADRHSDLIFAEIQNADTEVSLAAAVALSSLAKQGDELKISALLNEATDESQVGALQEALFAAVNDYEEGDKKSGDAKVRIVHEMMLKSGDKEPLYYPVLADIGGKEALRIVGDAFLTGNPAQKDAALPALCSWSDFTALDLLYDISKNGSVNHAGMALGSYISQINRSPNTPEKKVLMFRNAMERALDQLQQIDIIEGISRNSTLQSLVFVSKFLDHPTLQQSSAQAVSRIVLENPMLYGDDVKGIIMKAISVNKDPEADYQKEALLKHLNDLPVDEGYLSMFNGRDLDGWKGLVGDPLKRAAMTPEKLAEEQKKADEVMLRDWKVRNGLLVYEGSGYENLCTEKMYGDFEMVLDWRIGPGGDGGVYLRGTPQVQIWDTARVESGAQVGSGGLYNNKKYLSTPLVVADNPAGEWNTFRIKMIGDKVTVHLNGLLVTDNVILENYWDRTMPVFDSESIELQAHNSRIEYRDIYIREIPRPEIYKPGKEEAEDGFVPLFNGLDLSGWTGNKLDYFAQEGMLVCKPTGQGHDNLYTEKAYGDFILRFEFQLTPGANNGLGIRTPTKGDAAYVGMELQILDNSADIYKNLEPYQYHGSVYGVIPAKRGYLKPVGEWNVQEVQAIGTHIRVILNGTVILDGDIAEASKGGIETMDHKEHPGLLNESGHIGFLGHGSPLKFRNIRIKDLDQ